MAYYGPAGAFSPIVHEDRRGRISHAQAWSPDDIEGDLASPDIEMRQNMRPGLQETRSSSTLFPKPGEASNESQSFLHDPENKIDTSFSGFDGPPTSVPYKDHTGRQLRHLLLGSSVRFFITFALCAAYILAIRVYENMGAISEGEKKMCNAITTGISIALGLNIASAFKDSALNMRWPILAGRKRNLNELDLILACDSLMNIARLAIVSRRPLVILVSVSWLLINIAAQTGIALLSLTYGFNPDSSQVLLRHGNVSIPMMDHFYPWGDNNNPSIQDEQYIAHLYGGLAYNYGLDNMTNMPKAGDIYNSENAMLWHDWSANVMRFVFRESPPSGLDTYSIYTNRTIDITYACESHQVTHHGNGTFNNITVEDIGYVFVSHKVPDSTTFFTNTGNRCLDGNPRCSVVEGFEASNTDPWYYKCNVTLGQTQNDPHNYSQINDEMAFWATSSIAQVGYTDDSGQEAQIYPSASLWGEPLNGAEDAMGSTIATWAIGAIAGASMSNPSKEYVGMQPNQGFALGQNHPYFFYLILGLICICQFIFVTLVAIFTNRVMVGPDRHLGMSMLLRPIADALFGVSSGQENQQFRNAKKNTLVRYEKKGGGVDERWQLTMTDISRMI